MYVVMYVCVDTYMYTHIHIASGISRAAITGPYAPHEKKNRLKVSKIQSSTCAYIYTSPVVVGMPTIQQHCAMVEPVQEDDALVLKNEESCVKELGNLHHIHSRHIFSREHVGHT